MPERKVWSEEEDRILKLLKEERRERKWANIARIMDQQFGLPGRTGKQCRERYHNHLDSSIVSSEWQQSEEHILFNMHEQIGNKWSIISQKLPGRSDNCVKNHFYSKLRKSMRRLNKLIHDYFLDQFSMLTDSMLSKIIKGFESKFKSSSKIDEELADFCSDIKNRLFNFSFEEEQSLTEDLEIASLLIRDIHSFDRDFKKGYKGHKGPEYLQPPKALKKNSSTRSFMSERSESSSAISSSSFLSSSVDLSDIEVEEHQKGSKTTEGRSALSSTRNSADNTVKSEEGHREQPWMGEKRQFSSGGRMQAQEHGMGVQTFARQYSGLVGGDDVLQSQEGIMRANNFDREQQVDFYNESNGIVHFVNIFYQNTPVMARILGPQQAGDSMDIFAQSQQQVEDDDPIEYHLEHMDL